MNTLYRGSGPAPGLDLRDHRTGHRARPPDPWMSPQKRSEGCCAARTFKASRAVQPTAWKVRFLRRLVRRSRSSEVSPYLQPYPRRTHGRALPEHPDARLLGRCLALGADNDCPAVFARVAHSSHRGRCARNRADGRRDDRCAGLDLRHAPSGMWIDAARRIAPRRLVPPRCARCGGSPDHQHSCWRSPRKWAAAPPRQQTSERWERTIRGPRREHRGRPPLPPPGSRWPRHSSARRRAVSGSRPQTSHRGEHRANPM
jgi:hypothetical protein